MIRETARCHCAALAADIELSAPLENYAPRACDCDFCTRHGAAYLSDPQGSLQLRADPAVPVTPYRQGNELAEFWLCQRCGVLVAVTFEHATGLIGAINARALENAGRTAPAEVASPRLLDGAEKSDRWAALWFQRVSLTMSRH